MSMLYIYTLDILLQSYVSVRYSSNRYKRSLHCMCGNSEPQGGLSRHCPKILNGLWSVAHTGSREEMSSRTSAYINLYNYTISGDDASFFLGPNHAIYILVTYYRPPGYELFRR